MWEKELKYTLTHMTATFNISYEKNVCILLKMLYLVVTNYLKTTEFLIIIVICKTILQDLLVKVLFAF